MTYAAHTPYEILQNKLLDFATMQRLRRFAKYWDLVGNSGNFVAVAPLIWSQLGVPPSGGSARTLSSNIHAELPEGGTPNGKTPSSPFFAFLRFSDWLYAQIKRTDTIALVRLMEMTFQFLTHELGLDPKFVGEHFWRDCERIGRRDAPNFLKDFVPAKNPEAPCERNRSESSLPRRQARHLVA